jgi:UDPglucose--hexose-1-phosphate uridylyltransferase
MGEVRKDYVLDHWVVIVPKRGKRPHEYVREEGKVEEGTCFFCPGNEETTPEERGRINQPNSEEWQVRWFENKFAAFKPEGNPNAETHNDYYTFSSNYGEHEIIAETHKHPTQLAELSVEEIVPVIEAYKNRIEEHSKKENITYVNVFKNSGSNAGTSIVHSHSQVMATAVPNIHVQELIKARKKHDKCPWCEIVQREKDSERRVFENEDFVAFTPYASRYQYECVIFPKAHIKNLSEVPDFYKLAEALKHVISKLHAMGASYNYELYYSPEGEDLHFYIGIMPRINTWGGYEEGGHVIINSVPPEDAAAYYRE